MIVDASATGTGHRQATLDVIGAGPRAIAGVLEKRGLNPPIIVAEDFLKGAENPQHYDMLLISGMTSDITAIRHVASKWKKMSSGPIVIGGPVFSSTEDALIKAGGNLAIIGEGEQTLEELLDMGLMKVIYLLGMP